MDRARDELLARAGLARDEDRGVHGREARQRGEELAHRDARADELSEAGGRPDLDVPALRRIVVDDQLGRAEADLALVGDARAEHLQAIDERAVAAAEVADPEAILLRLELGVEARDGGVADHDARARGRAEEDLAVDHGVVLASPIDPRHARLTA